MRETFLLFHPLDGLFAYWLFSISKILLNYNLCNWDVYLICMWTILQQLSYLCQTQILLNIYFFQDCLMFMRGYVLLASRFIFCIMIVWSLSNALLWIFYIVRALPLNVAVEWSGHYYRYSFSLLSAPQSFSHKELSWSCKILHWVLTHKILRIIVRDRKFGGPHPSPGVIRC